MTTKLTLTVDKSTLKKQNLMQSKLGVAYLNWLKSI